MRYEDMTPEQHRQERLFLKRHGVPLVSEEKQKRMDLAQQRLKEQLSSTPYGKRVTDHGWESLQGSAALAD